MEISKKAFKVVGNRKEINFKDDNIEWSEAFLLYNSNHKDDELNMRHRFSYYTVRNWVIEQYKQGNLKKK